MKTDYDDYDDYENPGSRWVSVMVLLLAVAGFMALAWYAYQTGADQVQPSDEEVVVIEAEQTPIKEKPEVAGGMDFPHQEKTIYDAISKADPQEEEVKVLKDEVDETEPVIAEPKADSPVKERADTKVARLLREGMSDSKEKPEVEAVKKKEVAAPKEAEVLKQPDPFAAIEKAPKDVKESAVEKEVIAAPSKPVEVKEEPVAAVEVAPAAAPQVGASSAMVQLGAYGSQAEADANWAKIRAAHGAALSGLSPQVVRADLGAKGVFYRLRVRGFASAAAAKATCASLSARGQGCFLVQ